MAFSSVHARANIPDLRYLEHWKANGTSLHYVWFTLCQNSFAVNEMPLKCSKSVK